MKKSSFLCVLMVAALMSGCSKSELVGPAGIEPGQIALRSSITDVNASLTRAAYEGAISSTNPLTALVLTSLTSMNYSFLHANGTMTFTGAGLTAYNSPVASGSAYFSDYTGTGTTSHYLTGLYPATGWTVGTTNATFPLTGKEDVMFAPQVNTNYSTVVTAPASVPALDFKHQLTRLQLKVIKSSELSSAPITLTGAKVIESKEGLYSTAKVTLNSTQAVTFEDAVAKATGVSFVQLADDAAITSKTVLEADDAFAYTLVSPDKIESGKVNYTLAISYVDDLGNPQPDRKVYVELTDGGTGGTTAGYSYLITLTFNKGLIVAKATVRPWDNGTPVNVPF